MNTTNGSQSQVLEKTHKETRNDKGKISKKRVYEPHEKTFMGYKNKAKRIEMERREKNDFTFPNRFLYRNQTNKIDTAWTGEFSRAKLPR